MPVAEEQKEAKRAAEVRRLDAEAAKFEAEARKAAAEARDAENTATKSDLVVAKLKEEDEFRRAGDDFHRVYMFNGGVDSSSVESAINTLTAWDRLYPGEPFEVIFNSPGGSIFAGMRLFDFLRHLSDEGHEVTTGATGMAASMGGILVQAGDIRWTSAQSWYLIHRAAFGAVGKTFEIEDEAAFVKRIEERIVDIFVSRSKLTKQKIKRSWERKDWWLSSDELLEFGLVDRIGRAQPAKAA